MSFVKLTMAIALFVTSVNFQEQIITNGDQSQVNWAISLEANSAMANMLQDQNMYKEAALY
jgi:hypothetical protein